MYYTTMNEHLTTLRIDKLRSASRHVVRELGFMQKGLAGTEFSPSAVHTIIELGYGTVKTAGDIGMLLHLEKSSVSRLIQKLQKDGLIAAQMAPNDKRSRVLILTEKG
ncbi:MAG: MarR family transcriptional regulator, partial [Pseudomonadota bacterium]